jgi:hypothetical protein
MDAQLIALVEKAVREGVTAFTWLLLLVGTVAAGLTRPAAIHGLPPPQGEAQELCHDAAPGPPGRHPDGGTPGL